MHKTRPQQTLRKEVTFSGIGLHTGEAVTMRFLPAKADAGILFRRTDLPGKPEIPASFDYVCDTSRCTVLGVGSARVYTVEHVLAALAAGQIDNLVIEVSNIEPPIADGSSLPFLAMIEQAGILQLKEQKTIHKLSQPVFFTEGDVHLVALPSDEYRVSYTLHYPKISQYFSDTVSNFKKEIAPCRSFALYEEVSMLMDRGLIKGASLSTGLVIHGDATLSQGGLRFPDEMARHKALDLIGDLSLTGLDFHAHVIAIRSGHASNFGLAKKLYQALRGIPC